MKILIFIVWVLQNMTLFQHTCDGILVVIYLDDPYTWWLRNVFHIFIYADRFAEEGNLIYLSEL